MYSSAALSVRFVSGLVAISGTAVIKRYKFHEVRRLLRDSCFLQASNTLAQLSSSPAKEFTITLRKYRLTSSRLFNQSSV